MTELPAGPWGTQGRRDRVTGQDLSRDSLPPQGGAARGQLSTRLLVPGARAREAGAATPQTGRGHRGAWGTPGEGRPAGGLHDGSWPGPQQSSPAFSSADEEGWDGGTSLPLTQSRVGAREGTACRPRPPGSWAGGLGTPRRGETRSGGTDTAAGRPRAFRGWAPRRSLALCAALDCVNIFLRSERRRHSVDGPHLKELRSICLGIKAKNGVQGAFQKKKNHFCSSNTAKLNFFLMQKINKYHPALS